MKKIKVRGLSGAALDWAVAKCEIPNDVRDNRPRFWLHPNNPKLVCRITYNHETNPKGFELCRYSTDWSQGGPIIERESMQLTPNENMESWSAGFMFRQGMEDYEGSTPLIAAMRCYVASKLGNEIEIPDEL